MQTVSVNNIDVTHRILEFPGAEPKERWKFHIAFIYEGDGFSDWHPRVILDG